MRCSRRHDSMIPPLRCDRIQNLLTALRRATRTDQSQPVRSTGGRRRVRTRRQCRYGHFWRNSKRQGGAGPRSTVRLPVTAYRRTRTAITESRRKRTRRPSPRCENGDHRRRLTPQTSVTSKRPRDEYQGQNRPRCRKRKPAAEVFGDRGDAKRHVS